MNTAFCLRLAGFLLLTTLATMATVARAQAEPVTATAIQPPSSVQMLAEDYLRQSLSYLPGRAEITIEPLRNQNLDACSAMSAFLPSGSRARPRMTVGVRCSAPQPWTAYLQASVAVPGTYYVAATPLALGQTVTLEHLEARGGDLIRLAAGIVVNPDEAIGRTVSQRIAAGQPLRQSALRHAQAVLRGNTVKVLARGPGFMVASEGQAMDSAPPGSTVMVRTASGQIVSGVVQDAGTVEIAL